MQQNQVKGYSVSRAADARQGGDPLGGEVADREMVRPSRTLRLAASPLRGVFKTLTEAAVSAESRAGAHRPQKNKVLTASKCILNTVGTIGRLPLIGIVPNVPTLSGPQ